MAYNRRKSRYQHSRFYICVYLTFFAGLLVSFTFYYDMVDFSFTGLRIESNRNYFIEAEKYSQMGFIINTSNCHIPDINLWHSSITPYVTKDKLPPDCNKRTKPWTYVRGSSVIVDLKALAKLRHTLKTVDCCYKTIVRVTESYTMYNSTADNLFKYSEECYPMKEVTKPREQFIKVLCKRKDSLMWTINLYENFHAIALIDEAKKNIQRKIDKWKFHIAHDREGQKITPPNVVLFGIDSTSRLNFRRFAPKTVQFLQELGAVEIKGYTKVGENTFPNFVPIMSSYSEERLQKICYYNRNVLMDDCPFIWKDFNLADYFTAHIEDSPLLAIFNYMKTGFVKSPVDFYFRPFMMAVHQSFNGFPYTIDCIGYQTVDEVLTSYIADLLEMSKNQNVPMFLTSWLTNLSHDDMNNLRFADETYMHFLKRLKSNGTLDNTILFFMSDHGYRFGGQRETITGWYEDKLPNMWAYVSPDIQEKFPDWNQALSINSKYLSSPFDLHKTLVHILNMHPSYSMKHKKFKRKWLRSKMGVSLFKELPYDRTCDDAGIPENYCACTPPIKVPLNNSIIAEAAETAVAHINSKIPIQCARLILQSLIAGSTYNKTHADRSHRLPYTSVVVGFTTRPGNFAFEAVVNFSYKLHQFSVATDILRTNRINSPTGCISDPVLEVFCYCL